MQATVGDKLLVHGRVVGQHDKTAEIIEVLGDEVNPPYRVRFEDDGTRPVAPRDPTPSYATCRRKAVATRPGQGSAARPRGGLSGAAYPAG